MVKSLLIGILFLLVASVTTVVFAADYPAQCRVTAQTLNVRSGPGTGYSKMGTLRRGEVVQVDFVTSNGSAQWGCLEYRNGRKGYVSMRYMSYVAPVQQEVPESSTVYSSSDSGWFSGLFDSVGGLFLGLWTLIKWGVIIIIILVALAFWQDILAFLIFMGICSGIGAIVFGVLFDNSELGGLVGAGFAAFCCAGRFLCHRPRTPEVAQGRGALFKNLLVAIRAGILDAARPFAPGALGPGLPVVHPAWRFRASGGGRGCLRGRQRPQDQDQSQRKSSHTFHCHYKRPPWRCITFSQFHWAFALMPPD